MKGVSQLISTVIIVLITVTAIGIALLVGNPVIDKAKESVVFNEGLQNMKLLDNVIREVASEGGGSFRAIQMKVSGGEYKINSKTNTVEFVQTIKSGILQSGTFLKEGNVFVAAGTNAKASMYDLDLDGTSDIVLENEIMRVAILNNATPGNGINTSRILRLFNLKENGLNITVNDSTITIDNRTGSTIGNGIIDLVQEDEHLSVAEAVAHINTSIPANFTYDVVYTLRSGADFLIVKIQNISDYYNSSNIPTFVKFNFDYKIGDSKRDDVYDIGTINETIEVRNITRQFATTHGNLTNKYVCTYDKAQYSDGLLLSLIHSGKSDRLDYVNVSSLIDLNLTGFWKFDEGSGSTTADDSRNSNTGTLTNMNTTGNATSGWNASCKFGNCLRFDKSNDYVNVSDADSLSFQDFTLSAWVKSDSLVGHNFILGKGVDDANEEYVLAIISDGGIYIDWGAGAAYNQTLAGKVDLNKWYHVAAVYRNSTNRAKIYLNGTVVNDVSASATGDQITRTSADLFIGGARNGNSLFNGSIDDVRIYNRVLSDEEVSRLYNSSFAQYYSYSTSIRQKIVGSSLIIPFTKGTCKTISDNFYLVAQQDIPSKPFASFDLGGEDIPIQIYSTYDRLQLNGTDRFGSGSYKICVSNEGVVAGKPKISVRTC